QTLAVLGKEFPLGLVREAAGRPEDELDRMLRHLQVGEFIYEQPAFPEPEYSFKHGLTQEVAYNSVLTERRRLLHGRIGAALEKLYANWLEDHLPELAHHFARSADTAKAVEYLLKAGQSAAQRSVSKEALDRFEAGLRLLESLPAGPARDQRELAIRVAMWLPLLEVRGFAAAEIEVNLKRARELCDQTGAPAGILFQVIDGLRSLYIFSAKFAMAHSLAAEMVALGKEQNDEIASLRGHVWLGVIYELTGEYRAVAAPLQHSVAVCDHLLPGCPQPTLRPVTNSLINCLLHLSMTSWFLGRPEQAMRHMGRLLALPEQLCAKWDIGLIINSEFSMRCLLLRDYYRARENAEAMTALARQNGFSIWEALGSVMLGYVAVHAEDFDAGIKAILEGREMLRAGDNILFYQLVNPCLVEALLTARRPGEGLAAVDEAIAAANQFDLRRDEAELHRLKGQLLLLSGALESEAEASIRRAVKIAQRQDAKGWELRAAASLARLLRKQGRTDEARQALAPVYNWFTEGFDTADLKDAKALLDELGG
ncbi:MAG TPA: hypothetical protein VFE56_09225, partial [Candidatus Binataceae bacterium]|nr:hypothetical protein [Candidatus Binataceae bacterium]